jgi:hypothetical protein
VLQSYKTILYDFIAHQEGMDFIKNAIVIWGSHIRKIFIRNNDDTLEFFTYDPMNDAFIKMTREDAIKFIGGENSFYRIDETSVGTVVAVDMLEDAWVHTLFCGISMEQQVEKIERLQRIPTIGCINPNDKYSVSCNVKNKERNKIMTNFLTDVLDYSKPTIMGLCR